MRGDRHRLLRLGSLASAATVLAVVLGTGPVAAQPTPPNQWVQSLCSSLVDWSDELAEAQRGGNVRVRNLEKRRKAIVRFLRKSTQATDTLLDELDDAGTPDVPDGRRITAAFRRGFDQARKAFARARNDAKELDVEDRKEFEDAAGDIAAAIARGAARVDQTFTDAAERYGSSELDDAYNAEPSCSGIR